MKYFAEPGSLVRQIWGKADTILFIFAGAAAEFALNKAVDWLYYTGKLPADPIGRLFSTVVYAKKIIFSTEEEALKAIDKITAIHTGVEKSRGMSIPDWAYRDVLFMLVHYSISSFELLERKLSPDEKQEVYKIFYRVGIRMGLKEIPASYQSWLPSREAHLQNDLVRSNFTDDLFAQYKKHLGSFRYMILLQSQKLVVPKRVAELLEFSKFEPIRPLVPIYQIGKKVGLDVLVKFMLLPPMYRQQIKGLDVEEI
jgi:hypothetical protein